MENASKALIIAGSILVSIVIISLGVMIVSNVTDTINKTNLNDTEIQAYNGKFLTYEGTTVSGAQVKALCDIMRNHNNANVSDYSKWVHIVATISNGSITESSTVTDFNNTIAEVKKQVLSGHTHTIDFGYDPNTGLITEVKIHDNTANKDLTGK